MHIPNKGRADRREEGVPGLTLGGPRPLRHYREQPERMQGRREFQKVKINNQVTPVNRQRSRRYRKVLCISLFP